MLQIIPSIGGLVSYTLLALAPLLAYYFIFKKWKEMTLESVPKLKETFLFGNLDRIPLRSPINDVPLSVYILQGICGLGKIFKEDGIFLVRIGFSNKVFLTSYKTAGVLLNSPVELAKGAAYEPARKIHGNGILVVDDKAVHKKHRKHVRLWFNTNVLNEIYLPVMYRQSKNVVEALKYKINEKSFNLNRMLSTTAFVTMLEAAVGEAPYNYKKEGVSSATVQSNFDGICKVWMTTMMQPWLHMNDFLLGMSDVGKNFKTDCEDWRGFIEEIVSTRKKAFLANGVIPEEKNSKPKAYIDLLLQEQKLDPTSFTDTEVLNEVSTFLAAGYDTTSMTMAWTLFAIGNYPEVQAKVHSELDHIFGGDVNREITPEDLQQMKYLERCIKESQRLYPAVPIISRELQDTLEINGHKLPKGTSMFIPIYAIHRDPESFENPDAYDPDREYPDKSFVGFSAGPRDCIGKIFATMMIKTVLSNVLRHYVVTSLETQDKIVFVPNIMGTPHKPLRIKVEERHLGKI